ncbi:hypothetical protein BBOV_III003350 [Babesia bovis T2Bo]|uniref:Uncharacterized protein n=1 Tax=Babesia bovis TaxID=5865 RepID=A7AMW5_BABBO|nr:hypothetical protein BBOV_III003350 [Babesia bovis T2Bo]EDO07899.1 hypothetical protein BBOV_III003350 [Babesia bovis T2Bo]|eukprot:XP_001611467.1 hypothetical protein [Babesia bovis T2Bo]
MSRSKRRTLGLSSLEYEEGVILERIFQLAHRNRCATCLLKKPTFVDQDRLELLCDTCVRRCPYKLHIGHDHISKVLLERLESVYDRKSGHHRSGGHKSEHKKHGSHRRNRSISSSDRGASPRRVESHHRRSAYSKKHVKSFESATTEESLERYGGRSGWPEHSGMVTPPTKGRQRSKPGCPVDEDLFDSRQHRYYRDDDTGVRYPGNDPVDTSGHYMQPHRGDHRSEYRNAPFVPREAPRLHRDPYGYDIPVVDDMPGMNGIMMKGCPVRQEESIQGPGMPVGNPRGYRAPLADVRKPAEIPRGGYQVGIDYKMPQRLPAVRAEAPSSRGVPGSNPFASSIARDCGSTSRLDMTSMRLALPESGSVPVSRIGYDKYSRVSSQLPGVSSYGGLYDRRGRH